jgi:acyl-CoA synthetase (AMP-forming)/AMP-acid ligase II
MTETFTNATMLPFDAPYELRAGTMGRPVHGNRIRISDRATGAEMATGELGEITVAGMSIMRGYYKTEPALPVDAAGFLPTNDAGFITKDGLLVFAGRRDGLIKTAGVNVSPVEIEERLLDWGRLGTCGVVGVPHPTLGEAVVLCVALRPGDNVTAEEIRDQLRARLASYKVPHRVVFMEESEIPATVSGKVHGPQLRAHLIARLLDEDLDPTWKAVLRTQALAP